jgi:hypothetical protein
MVRKTDDLGGHYHEPPYTDKEIDDFYKRIGNGPIATRPVKKPQLPQPQEQGRPELKRK